MQWIKYNYVCGYDEEGNEILIQKKIGYNEANLTIAESEAYNGEYTVEEDSKAYSTEPLEIEFGGTGASNKESALKNLGITATASELNTLDGVTATANEINYVKGATSNIQTQINKKADLGSNGLIPTSQLPSYVDDVLEYAKKVNFPTTGATGKIYVDLATNLTYRWSGSAYVEISPSLALGETSSTAYRGDRGKIAYDHSQTPHNYSPSGHSHDAATQSANGLMSASDKKKLDGIATGANAYTHPAYTARTGVPTANATPGFGGTFSVTQPVSDATGHITGMNSRTITIPSAVATQSANGLMTAADKKKLDGIATGANAYSHPTTSGNKHIPSGGAAGDILHWSADGTAIWGEGNRLGFKDTRNTDTPPSDVPVGLSLHLKNAGANGISDGIGYEPTLMLKPYWDKSGSPFGEIALTSNNNLWFRTSAQNSDTDWKSWKRAMSAELLWANPNPFVPFAEQTHTFSESIAHYSYFLVTVVPWCYDGGAMTTILFRNQQSGFSEYWLEANTNTWYHLSRPIKITDTTIEFGPGGTNGATAPERYVPWHIFGIC